MSIESLGLFASKWQQGDLLIHRLYGKDYILHLKNRGVGLYTESIW